MVSLLASTTKVVCALGCVDRLVGRSHECDRPPGVLGLPVCSAPAEHLHGSSAEIDRSVRRLVEEGLSIYRVDVDRLRSLQPDLILTQDQCEVCAVNLEQVQDAVAAALDHRPETVSVRPMTLADILASIERVAVAVAVPDRGRRLAGAVRAAVVDGGAHVNRPGPRIAESVQILAGILHPDRVGRCHHGAGWRWASPVPA